METVRFNVDCLSPYFCTLQHVHFATHALWNMCTLHVIVCIVQIISLELNTGLTSNQSFSIAKEIQSKNVSSWRNPGGPLKNNAGPLF